MENTLLVVLVVLQSITLIVLAVAAVFYLRRTNEAIRDFGQTAKDVRDCLVPVAQDLRTTIKDTDELVLTAKTGIESMSRLAGSVAGFTEVGRLFHAAGTAKTTVGSVIEGIKVGLHALKSSKSDHEEGT